VLLIVLNTSVRTLTECLDQIVGTLKCTLSRTLLMSAVYISARSSEGKALMAGSVEEIKARIKKLLSSSGSRARIDAATLAFVKHDCPPHVYMLVICIEVPFSAPLNAFTL